MFFFFFCFKLGNPVLEFATDLNSRAEFFWSHGLISDSTYHLFTSVCNYSRYVSEYYRDNVSSLCSRVMSQVTKETSRFVDNYDVTLDVCLSSVFSQSKAIVIPQVNDCLRSNCFSLILFCAVLNYFWLLFALCNGSKLVRGLMYVLMMKLLIIWTGKMYKRLFMPG